MICCCSGQSKSLTFEPGIEGGTGGGGGGADEDKNKKLPEACCPAFFEK